MASEAKETQKDVNFDPVQRFENFFRFFQDEPDKSFYLDIIKRMFSNGESDFVFLYEHLMDYDPRLGSELRENPDTLLSDAYEGFLNIMRITQGDFWKPELEEKFHVRVFTRNDSLRIKLSELREEHLCRLVYLEGMVNGLSRVKPEVEIATFECKDCGHQFEVEQYQPKLIKPSKCLNPGCKNTKKWVLVKKDSKSRNHQTISIQELIEENPGKISKDYEVVVYDNLVECCQPGDKIKLMANYQMEEGKDGLRIFNTYLEAIMIEATIQDPATIETTPEEDKKIDEIAHTPNLIQRLTYSLSPNIEGRDNEKLALLLAIVGGVRRKKRNGKWSRGDIHVLLAGDPSSGKSALMDDVFIVCPRVIQANGGGASGVGLTAALVKDEITNAYTLRAGVLVLANGGVALIDEFNRMPKDDRSKIHPAMEQQRFAYNKGGFNVVLPSRTTIIAATNPVKDRWDGDKLAMENMQDFDEALLSRFDEILVFQDLPNWDMDQKIGGSVLDLEEQKEVPTISPEDYIPTDLLRKYLYSARKLKPVMSDDLKRKLIKFYASLRATYEVSKKIAFTPRNLEGLRRLCEAYAKLCRSEIITSEMVDFILWEHYMKYMRQFGYDAKKEEFDVDLIKKNVLAKTSSVAVNKEEIEDSLSKAKKKAMTIFKELLTDSGENYIAEEDFKGRLVVENLEGYDPNFIESQLINYNQLDLEILNRNLPSEIKVLKYHKKK